LTAQRPLHVLFDARMVYYRRAGIGQYAVNLLRAMARTPEMGPRSRVSVMQMRADRERIVRDRRFRRVAMWTPPHNRFEQPALGLELLAVRPRPSLVHSPDFVPPRFRRFPAVANIQDLAFLKLPEVTLLTEESRRYYEQVPRAARDAEALIALSQSAKDDTVELLGVPPEKIAVIPGAAGPQFNPPADREAAQREATRRFGLPAPEDGGYILFVGTIEPRKNLPALLEAYSLLRARGNVRPLPALAIAGAEGWLYERTYLRIDELGLRNLVRLLGALPDADLPPAYRGARAFALPSLYEGFGLPALEALACGVPVLASDAGSLPEVVGDAGVLLDPLDVDLWADMLEQVLLDAAFAQGLREAGPRRAAQFSWERAASETWRLYERMVGESK
jgi:glycosyltransferase involved in cell wall biosynthesis